MYLVPLSGRLLVSTAVVAAWLLAAAPAALQAQQPTVSATASPAPASALSPAATAPVPNVSVPPAPAATPALPPPVARFYSPRTVLWLGRTAVIPFKLSRPAPGDSTLTASVHEHGLFEILQPPTVLAGQSTGFLRVRGLLPGRTRLLMQGDAAIDLEIKPDPAAAVDAQINPESGRPRIISPSADAVVWGRFAGGVEVFDRFDHIPGPAGSFATTGTRVQLRLPDGRLLDPVMQTGLEFGPERHCQFSVQASDLPPGPVRLVAVACPIGFSDVDRRLQRPGLIMESEPLVLDALPVPPKALWSGECEDPVIMGTSKELLAPAHTIIQGVIDPRVPDVRPENVASGGRTVFVKGGQTAWCLPFNVESPGLYQLFVQARGSLADGAFPSLALYLGSTELAAGTVRLSSGAYARVPVGTPVRLEAGPRMFAVAYRNDFGQNKESRDLYLDRWEVARVGDLPPDPAKDDKRPKPNLAPAAPAAPGLAVGNPGSGLTPRPPDFPALTPLPPAADLLYPANGANVFGLDAVVSRLASATARAAWVDVLVDGQPQGERAQGPALASGELLVFPLLARQLAPGPHRLGLRVADASGQTADSPTREFNVLAQAPAVPGPYAHSVFLLDRLAFGVEGRELAAVLTQGSAAWLDQRLVSSFDAPAEQTLLRAACKQYPQINSEQQVIDRALYQWLGSDNPVRSRFTAWAENHFNTWINKTEAGWKWPEHLAFCRLGIAPFADLLSASAHSPAMLKYLDQEKSTAGKLNENYAREIMELHTLGVHGGYKQTDVTALAGVLNGWTTTREVALPQEADGGALGLVPTGGGNGGGVESTFHFDPFMNDGKAREVFGLRFPAAKDAGERHDHIREAMEMLASHPGTADHVCRKLAEHYVGVPAPDGLVHALADTFLASGGDMRAVLRALVAQPGFWQAPPRLATPFDFGLRVARLCQSALPPAEAAKALVYRPNQLEGFLKKSGMGLFDRVTPDGYPEDGADYADSNALLQRWRFMQTLNEPLNRLVPIQWRTPPPLEGAMTRAANEGGSIVPAAPDAGQRFIDLAAARLTGHLLAPDSNQAALEVLAQGTPDQMHAALVFIALLPETSLR